MSNILGTAIAAGTIITTISLSALISEIAILFISTPFLDHGSSFPRAMVHIITCTVGISMLLFGITAVLNIFKG